MLVSSIRAGSCKYLQNFDNTRYQKFSFDNFSNLVLVSNWQLIVPLKILLLGRDFENSDYNSSLTNLSHWRFKCQKSIERLYS